MIFFLRFFLRNVNSRRKRLSLGHTTYPCQTKTTGAEQSRTYVRWVGDNTINLTDIIYIKPIYIYIAQNQARESSNATLSRSAQSASKTSWEPPCTFGCIFENTPSTRTGSYYDGVVAGRHKPVAPGDSVSTGRVFENAPVVHGGSQDVYEADCAELRKVTSLITTAVVLQGCKTSQQYLASSALSSSSFSN